MERDRRDGTRRGQQFHADANVKGRSQKGEHTREERRKELDSKLKRMVIILDKYTRLKYM